eukprot:gene25975-31368_t
MIVDLPECLAVTLLCDWLVYISVVALDSALSVHRDRKCWLHVLSRTSKSLWPKEIKWTKKENVCSYLYWVVSRGVATNGISLTLDLALVSLLVRAATEDHPISFPEVKSITLDASIFDLDLPSVSVMGLFPLMECVELCHLSSDILWQVRQAVLRHPTLTTLKFTQRNSYFEELLQNMIVEVGDKLQRLTLLTCLSTPLLQALAQHAPNIEEVCCASDMRISDIVYYVGSFRQLRTMRIRLGRQSVGVLELSRLFDLDPFRGHLKTLYIGSDHLDLHVLPVLTKALTSCQHLQELEMCGLYAKIDQSAVLLKLSGTLEVTEASMDDMVAFISAIKYIKLPIELVVHGSLFYTEHLCKVLENTKLGAHVTSLTLSLRDVAKPYIRPLVKLCPNITSLHLLHHSNSDRQQTLALFGCLVSHCQHVRCLSLQHLYNGQHAHVTNDHDVRYFLQSFVELHTLDLAHFTTSAKVLQYLGECRKVMHKVCLSGLGMTAKELCTAFSRFHPAIKQLHYQATSFHKQRMVGYGKMPIRLEHLQMLFVKEK